MKEICIDLTFCLGLGDLLGSTPTIKKISIAYNKKISIITYHPEVFLNNPWVDKIFSPHEFDFENDNFQVFKTFDPYEQSLSQTSLKNNLIDIRQFHALMLGFSLSKDEMDMIYVPNNNLEIENLPKDYVLIHPVQNWASRTWDIEKWNQLIKTLNDNDIAVVAIGKDSSEVGTFNTQKPVFDVYIEKGLNLLNQTNLSDCWWLIENSICFITMDSGLLHLAGTTSANIIQLGSSINKEFRAPYRRGSQDYKYFYAGGKCTLSCASNLKYGVKEWKSILGVPPLVGCLEHKETFECHPSPEQVHDIIMNEILPQYNEYQNKKKIFIIGTYPSTTYNESMLIECIERLNRLNFDILLVSHFQVSSDIQKMVNYYIYDYDNTLDPIERTPYAYFANSSYFVKIQKQGYISTICRNIVNGLKFAKNKGYDFFYYMESDNLFHELDLIKLRNISQDMFSEQKQSIMFKYSSDGSNMYESLIFGGVPEFYLNNLPLPESNEDFTKISVGLTLELHFYNNLIGFKDQILEINSSSKDYFTKSIINKNSNCAFVEVLKDLTNGGFVLYTANYRENDHNISFQINNNESYELIPNSWYFAPITSDDTIKVKIFEFDNIFEKTFSFSEQDKELYSETGTINFY
jgi:hypothetical protein